MFPNIDLPVFFSSQFQLSVRHPRSPPHPSLAFSFSLVSSLPLLSSNQNRSRNLLVFSSTLVTSSAGSF